MPLLKDRTEQGIRDGIQPIYKEISMKKCPICMLVQILAGVGALNWGLVALGKTNLVAKFVGVETTPAKAVYLLIAIAGAITLITLIKPCPCNCSKK